MTIGGNGGSGGNAGPITVTNTGLVFTLGEEATGILAQSVGGGGGNGAVANADTGSIVGQDNKLAVSVNLGIGGRGGAGGSGGTVGVTVDGSVLTRGDAAAGVLAQSVGGGGGTGALGKVLGSGGTISVNLGIGGNGGAGGNGGTVTFGNDGAILTEGGDAPAVMAQSIGGGGGDGGEAATAGGTFPALPAAKFLAGGFGIGLPVSDNGGSGVFSLLPSSLSALASLKELRTVLQSYNASNTNAPKPPGAGTAKTTITVRIGAGFAGAGGAGGTGGPVSVTNSGQLQTDGPDSAALMAESVGGGGGAGGAANPASNLLISNPSAIDLTLGVGGSGGSSGNGGTVTVANSGYILTSSDASDGIVAQSIGGGGGDGGATLAENGVLGKASFSIGGSGGSSGAGGSVSVSVGQNDNADIDTLGRNSTAVLAQSIGGGGGDALLLGTTTTGQGGNGRSGTGLSNGSLLPDTSVLSITVDGPGGGAGHGGPVTVSLNSSQGNGLGLIYTAGTDSYGVLAQSIGGGGGLLTGVTTRSNTLSTLFTGPRTCNCDGGPVAVTLERAYSIYTDGAGGAGIVAQSIGGGGGLIGGLDKVDVTAPIRTTPSPQSGQGGNVTVTLSSGGNIVTNGVRAHGILAESLGGGGGILDQPNGSGFAFSGVSRYTACSVCTGAVVVTIGSDTVDRVLGSGAWGVVVQSRGNGVNDTTVNVGAGGYVESWGQSAGAIFVDGAGTNRIINAGTIDNGTLAGAPTPSGLAIGGNAPATITNAGTINGSIVLPQGSAVANGPGGLLDTGAVVTLGPGDPLTNDGTLSPDGSGHLGSTLLTGNLVQNSDGTLVIDTVPATGAADHLQVIGQATLGGGLQVIVDGPVSLVPHATMSNIVTATGGLNDGSLQVVSGTPVVAYAISHPDPNDLDLTTTVDFAAPAALGAAGLLSRDREDIGGAFGSIELAGPGALAPVAEEIAAVPTASALAATYDSLSGQSVVDAQSVSFGAQHLFEATVLQRIDGDAGIGVPASATPKRLGPEAWIVGFGGNDLLKGAGGAASLQSQTAGGAFGIADRFTDNLMAGLSVGGGSSAFSVSGETDDGTDRSVNVGLYGLARHGRFYASGVLAYGNYGVNETRVGIGQEIGLEGAATSGFAENAFGGRLELGRVWSRGRLDVTPFAALEADGLWQGSVAETAAAGSSEAASVALRYGAHSDVSMPSTLGARADWRLAIGNGQVLVPTVELGWVHEFSSVRTLDAAFAGAPGVTFETEGAEASRNAAETSIGASLSLTGAISLIGTFEGTFSNVETAVGGYAGIRAIW